VEEFRHTPIIPISEKDLADHKRKVEEANRKGYYVEIKKDTIYFYSKLYFSFILFPFQPLHYSNRIYGTWNDLVCLHDDEWEADADKERPGSH
jgi:hypothetical protein